MNSKVATKVLSVIERYQMFHGGETIIVGLSGGADSMTLLSVLNDLKTEYNLKLIAAHVNHGLRGDEALRDEEFAKDYCSKLGAEFRVLHANVPQIAKETGESFEECGRRVRYEFFASIQKDALIATAHTASDCAETFLFNLTRGSGLRGLCSIPAQRDNIVRPLIECTRKEVEEYCAENNIDFVTDSTNLDTEYARNKIRHLVLPELEKINPEAEASITRCINSLRLDENYLENEALKLVISSRIGDGHTYNANTLFVADDAVKSRAIADLVYGETNSHPEYKHILKIMDLLQTGGKLQIPGGAYVLIRNGVLSFPHESENPGQKTVSYKVISKKDENFCKLCDKKSTELLENALDYDKIKHNFLFRNRKDGDKFRPRRRNVTKTLKNLFNEAQIPPEKRNEILMLETDDQIAWIEGFGPAEGFVVSGTTENIMLILLG